MKAVEETIAALGVPIFLLALGGEGRAKDAKIARWRHGAAVVDIAASDTVRVTVSLQSGHRVHSQNHKQTSGANVRLGSVMILPAHERTRVTIEGEADVLQIFVREAFLHSAVEMDFECRALFNSHNVELQAAAMQLFVAASRRDPDDSLLLESGVHRLAAHLADHSARQPPGSARGGLARAAQRRVDDMIAAAVDNATIPSPTLGQLAGAASLSVNHFIRAFRQQTGMTPHRHLVLRRVERGVALLKKPGKSVAEVADDTGFATPAHFVATFRRTMGVTPGAVQAAFRG